MTNAKVVVKYNSYMDEVELGDLTCDQFDDILDVMDYVTSVRKVIPSQLKFDPSYRDVWEAKLYVYIKGELIGRENYRRHADVVQVWTPLGKMIEV